ncbi:MAG: serine hydrolase domain-containing protein [Flavobacteriaceae bacterium]
MKEITFLMLLICALQLQAQHTTFPEQKQEAVKQLFEKYTDMGIPGLALTVYSPSTGFWSYAHGFSNKEEKKPLTSENLYYLQSVSKTYMAVIVLKLYEKGKIDLDDPINKYISYPWLEGIKGAEKITVRMLLNHTSGLPEYSTDALLVSQIIQDPLKVLTVEQMLSFIDDTALSFAPGSQYQYRNTNYALLSLIADKVTGNHIKYMEEAIFRPLDLKTTKYLTKENHSLDLNLVDAYWDVLLQGQPVNISKLQRANVASMRGDDGMITTTAEAVIFLKGLVEGKLIKPKTLKLMQEWVKDEEGAPRYGLGVAYYDLDVTYAIGHSGGGVGSGCILLYLPELESIVFVATNFNTMMESPIRKKAENLQTEVLMTLFGE